jgi:hypothetical protein
VNALGSVARRAFGGGALILVAASVLSAQTIRPLISEFKTKARGKLQLQNDAAWPLRIYLEAKSFSVSEAGDMIDAPLDAGIHVKLSAMSLQIPPGESRFVFYEATADRMPAWFVLYAVFTGFPARDFKGVNVQVELPHIVYILPNEKLRQADLRVSLVEFKADEHKVVLDIENVGATFGRILTTELRGQGTKAISPGFAMFPGRHRRLELPWKPDEQPDTAVLKSRDFTFDQKLRIDRP